MTTTTFPLPRLRVGNVWLEANGGQAHWPTDVAIPTTHLPADQVYANRIAWAKEYLAIAERALNLVTRLAAFGGVQRPVWDHRLLGGPEPAPVFRYNGQTDYLTPARVRLAAIVAACRQMLAEREAEGRAQAAAAREQAWALERGREAQRLAQQQQQQTPQ